MVSRVIIIIASVALLAPASPDGRRLLKQVRNGEPAVLLTTVELHELGDPFFELVLKEHGDVVSLAEIEKLLQPDSAKRSTFVVHEDIVDPATGQHRRAVLTYSGTNQGIVLDGNVMISVFFDSSRFPDGRFIEVWGWDARRARYNYYKLDRTGVGDQSMRWKFRGSSVGADLLTREERAHTCMECHVSGAPIMKELPFPWNNWHSFESVAPYLRDGSESAWPAAASPFLKDRLTGAERLESFIVGSISEFNNRRINMALERRESDGDVFVDSQGRMRVLDGRRLLRHLFVTTEYNIGSARQKSGLHPAGGSDRSGPSSAVQVPATFFLNESLIAGDTNLGIKGLGIDTGFSRMAEIRPAEYRRLVSRASLQVGTQRGDAHFAWFVPIAGHIDNSMANQLLKRGVVSPEFVAAVLAVDLETPVFSEKRAQLLRFVPDEFTFAKAQANGVHPDALVQATIASLEAAKPKPGSPEALFLGRLKSTDPIGLLRDDVAAYRTRVEGELRNPERRPRELQRLFEILAARRRSALDHPVLGALDENGKLFPTSGDP